MLFICLLLLALQGLAGFFKLLPESLYLFGLVGNQLSLGAQSIQLSLAAGDLFTHQCQVALHKITVMVEPLFSFDFLLDGSDIALKEFGVCTCLAVFVIRGFAENFPLVQSKDGSQDFFTLRRLFCSEGVCLALQEERSVDETLIIQPQGIDDLCIGLAQRAFGQDLPAFAGCFSVWLLDEEIDLGGFPTGVTAGDTIDLVFVRKVEDHLCGFAGGVDDGFVLRAGFTVERVSDGIQQRGFSGAVSPGDTSQVKTGEIDLNWFAVGSETRQAQFNRNHRPSPTGC